MAVRVVARIRPPQHKELDQDVIVSAVSNNDDESHPTQIKIRNPRTEKEDFTFQFSSVYDHPKTQQELFDNEVAPTIKHLFGGFDVTIFAYGSTGSGKTHTMRGGKSLAERGIIPRLLSGIYRRARKITKESIKGTRVEISLSYCEIYNDRLYDLFEAPEKRSLAGLPLRDNGKKAVVVGLTERPCENLKDFERLYDQANLNRSTSATKLNAVSSRSHAILGIKLTVITGDEIRVSTASAIDLAGSEDNRRTENRNERMIESANINKSLFTLAKCVEAISRQDVRIPYRESKMTRILNIGMQDFETSPLCPSHFLSCKTWLGRAKLLVFLQVTSTWGGSAIKEITDPGINTGQNNSLTVMILNLAPERAHHQDTLSSLNFANRTKRIEVREIENQPVFKGCTREVPALTGASLQRQPLRPLASSNHNSAVHALKPSNNQGDRQVKAFSVYSDGARLSNAARMETLGHPPLKRPSDPFPPSSRPTKRRSLDRVPFKPQPTISQEAIEKIIEDKVTGILTARALDHSAMQPDISMEVKKRLEVLEKKIIGKDDGREQGLTYLLMAKQHTARGECSSALIMYTLAKDYFPDNQKLDLKIEKLRGKIRQGMPEKRQNDSVVRTSKLAPKKNKQLVYSDYTKNNIGAQGGRVNAQLITKSSPVETISKSSKSTQDNSNDETEIDDEDKRYESDGSFHYKAKTKKKGPRSKSRHHDVHTPRTKRLLDVVNARDISQIKLLRGVGAKKAEIIVEALGSADEDQSNQTVVKSLTELGRLKGVGPRTVESMRVGLQMS